MDIMLTWMPGVTHDDRGGSGPATPGSNVIVLHSTETKGPASYPGDEPHFEVYGGDEVSDEEAIRQFVALNRDSRALWNEPGGVETNRRAGHIIQIELVWYAANAQAMPDTLLRRLALVTDFIRSQIDVPLVAPPQGWWMPGFIARVDSLLRFSFAAWLAYSGFCAHANIPENDHWDCGPFPWDRFITFLAPQEAPDMTPDQVRELFDMVRFADSVLKPLTLTLHVLGNGDWDLGASTLAVLLMKAAKQGTNGPQSLTDVDVERIAAAVVALESKKLAV